MSLYHTSAKDDLNVDGLCKKLRDCLKGTDVFGWKYQKKCPDGQPDCTKHTWPFSKTHSETGVKNDFTFLDGPPIKKVRYLLFSNLLVLP